MRVIAHWKLAAPIGLIMASQPAYAAPAAPVADGQNAVAGQDPAAKTEKVEEIIVTAQRRSERLQDVPIAITALTGNQLAQSGIRNTQELTQAVPNLVMTSAGSTFQAIIRGVGTRGVTQGDEANVAIYVDGVYQPDQSSANFEFLNVQRIEVLRGPQGTLFGRNATGGLINIVTKEPSFTTSGAVDLSYGRFDEKVVNAYVTTGITSNLAIDVAGIYRSDDGYVYNIFRKVWENPRDSRAIRSKLLFTPTDRLKLVLSGGYSYSNDPTPMAYSPLNGNFAAKATFPGILIPRKYQVATNTPTFNKKFISTFSLQGSYDLGGVTLNSITSYQSSRAHYFNDNDGSQITISYLHLHSLVKTATQELRLASNPGSKFQWVAGAFGFLSHAGYDPLVFCCTTTTGTGIPRAILSTQEHIKSIALFADGTYPITDRFSLTAGLRYTWEGRHHEFVQTAFTTGALQGQGAAHASFTDFSPRASLKYKFSDAAMAYLTYSRGFKSGVFNASSITQLTPVRPEKIDAYEFGIKADPLPWLRTNLAMFYDKYRDIQLSATTANSSAVLLLNAANSTIKGVEFEATARAGSDLDLRLGASYLDAKYDKFPGAVINTPLPQGGNSQTVVNLVGTDMIRAPRTTFEGGINYHHRYGDGSAIGFNGNIYRTAKYYWDFQNRLTVPAYTKINAELTFTLPNGTTRMSLWGRNLTNVAVPQNLLPSTGIDDVTYEPPRTYGIALHQTF